jgi:flagellar motor protein MotB
MQAQAVHEPRYLRFQADDTQLSGARDDARYTYLEFEAPPGKELELFDQEGRPLDAAIAGRVAAVDGLHAGILVRRAERASFVSPNPRTLSLPRVQLPTTADHGEARAKLENQAGQLQAMRRAMEAAKVAAAGGARRGTPGLPAAALSPSSSLAQSQPVARTSTQPPPDPWMQSQSAVAAARSPFAEDVPRLRHLPQLLRSLQAETVGQPRPSAAPLAAANASASAPERGLVRVFFATASRAIVAPEDGLGLLLREAGNADEVRVTGYTDASGSRATNDALALARAQAIVQILLRRGIPAERIFTSAVGADDYIADNASERGRGLNRRVEVLLLKNGMPLPFSGGAQAAR